MVGAHVKWTNCNHEGWAGPGIGRVIAFESNRLGFGEARSRRQAPHGPACHVKLDHNGLSVWVEPDELDEVAAEAADEATEVSQ